MVTYASYPLWDSTTPAAFYCQHGYRILEVHGPVVPNIIASDLLQIRP